MHVYVRLQPRWDSYQVRAAAVALARELERRRPDLMTAAWWKEERGRRVFIDFNQNAPHKTIFGAWSVRARPGAQVSTPWPGTSSTTSHPDELTIATVPAAAAAPGDPWATMSDDPQSLDPCWRWPTATRPPGCRRAVAAGLPEAARRAAPRGAQPGPQAGPARPGLNARSGRGQDIRAISRILLVASSAATLYDSASVG